MARAGTRIKQLGLLGCLLLQAATGRADKSARPPSPAPAPAASPTATPFPPKLELDGPEAEAKDRARVLFGQGVAAYREGKYYLAVEIFLETQRIYPDVQLLFNVARAYENIGNVSGALRYYRDYLRQADRPSDGADVRERVRRLQEQLAERSLQQLTVLSQPEGATVSLDGKPIGITPFTIDTYPGKHRLGLTLSGHAAQEQVVDLEAHAARDAAFVLMPLPSAPAPAPLRALPDSDRQSGVRLGTLVTLSTGVALLGGALIAQAVSDDSGLSPAAAFFAGSGLGVTSLGGAMLYFDLAPGQKKVELAPSRQKDSATARP